MSDVGHYLNFLWQSRHLSVDPYKSVFTRYIHRPLKVPHFTRFIRRSIKVTHFYSIHWETNQSGTFFSRLIGRPIKVPIFFLQNSLVDQSECHIITRFIRRPIKVIPFYPIHCQTSQSTAFYSIKWQTNQSATFLLASLVDQSKCCLFYSIHWQTNQSATFLPALSVDQSECYLFTRFIHRPVKVHPFYSIFSCNIFSGAVVAVF